MPPRTGESYEREAFPCENESPVTPKYPGEPRESMLGGCGRGCCCNAEGWYIESSKGSAARWAYRRSREACIASATVVSGENMRAFCLAKSARDGDCLRLCISSFTNSRYSAFEPGSATSGFGPTLRELPSPLAATAIYKFGKVFLGETLTGGNPVYSRSFSDWSNSFVSIERRTRD